MNTVMAVMILSDPLPFLGVNSLTWLQIMHDVSRKTEVPYYERFSKQCRKTSRQANIKTYRK